MIAEIRSHSQITLPASVIKKLNLKKGDKVEIELDGDTIIMRPVITVPRDQAWFWSKKWQDDELRVERDIKRGLIKGYDSVDELIEDLDK